MIVKLLTEHHLEFVSLKGGCTGSSESTLVKMPHCWKLHVTAYMYFTFQGGFLKHEGSGLCMEYVKDSSRLLMNFCDNKRPGQKWTFQYYKQ